MSHFLGRTESISYTVPPLTFQQIPPLPFSDVVLQFILNKRSRKKEKSSSVRAIKLLLQTATSELTCMIWPRSSWKVSMYFIGTSFLFT